MQRRKFVIGMGALASGAAATLGTGAFTSVNANRSVDVEVAGDANAYLGLEPVSTSDNSDYVQVNNGEVSIDFSSSNPNTNSSDGSDLGNGFNTDATTVVNDLLRVTNQGTQAVDFTINLGDDLSTGSAGVTLSTDELDGQDDLVTNSITIPTGESIVIDLRIDTTDQDPAGISGTIIFVADANAN